MHTLNDMSHEDMALGHHYEDVHRDHYGMDSGGHHVNYNIDPELYPHSGHHVNDPKFQGNFSGKTSVFLSRGKKRKVELSLFSQASRTRLCPKAIS